MTTPNETQQSAAASKQRSLFGDEVKAPSPAPPKPVKPKRELTRNVLDRRLRLFDRVLLGLLLLLAFFLGSFAAHNSDIFLHLGLGSPFGPDADSSGWVHHAWLSSLLLRVLYDPFASAAEPDGRWAVVAKALVVVLIAFVMYRTCRRGSGRVVPVACTALAVVVMSPRLTLQPMVVSMLFLGVTLWILTLSPIKHPRAVWLLPPLFALWVNMDQWFILGPMTVALWLVGDLLGRYFDSRRFGTKVEETQHGDSTLRGGNSALRLAMVLLVGLACCLINPWFHRAFQLPAELAFPSDVVPTQIVGAGRTVALMRAGDPQFMMEVSPFSRDYLSSASLGKHVAGWAFFLLLFVGFASFVLIAGTGRRGSAAEIDPSTKEPAMTPASEDSCFNFSVWPLIVIFVFFGFLSALNYRLIPFFAVCAGPIAALSLLGWLSRTRRETTQLGRAEFNWAILGRWAVFLVLLVLLACAWPGWLHAFSDNWRASRHVAWFVAHDPGVKEAADIITKVRHKTGLCSLGFSYTVEGANLFAWTNTRPGPSVPRVDKSEKEVPRAAAVDPNNVRLLCDARFASHADVAEDYASIRKAIKEESEFFFTRAPRDRRERQVILREMDQSAEGYRKPMRKLGINYVVFARLHLDIQAQKVVDCFLLDPLRQWALLYHDGRTAVFGWIDPANPQGNDAYRAYRLSLDRLVVSPDLPPNVPHIEMGNRTLLMPPRDSHSDWQMYLHGPTMPALPSFRAGRYVGIFNMAAADWERRGTDILTSGVGSAAVAAGDIPAKGPVRILKDAKGQSFAEPLFSPQDMGPPAALVFAVRTARKATQDNVNDVNSHLSLAEAYQALQARQEDYWSGRTPLGLEPYKPSLRHQLRRIQFITALNDALACQPDNPSIHVALHELYYGIQYFDYAVDHLLLAKNIHDGKSPENREQEEAAQYRERFAKALGDELKRRHDSYLSATAGRDDFMDKFEAALIDHSQKAPDGGPLPRGLVRRAQQILRDAPESIKKDPSKIHALALWEIYLMLTTGQAREAHDVLHDPVLPLRGSQYELYRGFAAAALGDYVAADKHLALAEQALKMPPDDELLELRRKPASQLSEHLVTFAGWMTARDGYPGHLTRMAVFYQRQLDIMSQSAQFINERRHAAELRLLRGLLALEQGDTARAAKLLHQCLEIVPFGLEFPDRTIAQRYLEILEKK